MTEIRKELQWFSQEMEDELKRNDHKPGWNDSSARELFHSLYKNAKNLQEELSSLSYTKSEDEDENEINKERLGYVIMHAVDVANFAMMIADNARKIRGGDR